MNSIARALAGALCASVLTIGVTSSAMAQTIADSFADFSGTQGQNGWYYGLASGGDHMGFVSSSFAQFSTYQSSVINLDGLSHGVWGPAPGFTWTQLWAEGGHPTGPNYSGTSVAVRRWVSTHEGNVVLDGILSDWHPGFGDGAGGAIYVDDQRVWDGLIGDGGATSFNFTTLVHQGSTVDFVLGAKGNDYTDSTKFSATIAIAPIPEPETYAMMLAGLGLLGFVGRRRKQRAAA